jgi:hypothetical protein
MIFYEIKKFLKDDIYQNFIIDKKKTG